MPTKQNKADFFRCLPLFERLDDSEMERLTSLTHYLEIPRQTVLYHTGSPSDRIFFLSKGSIKICSQSEDGREIIKSILIPKSMFGDMGVAGEKVRSSMAMSLHESTYLYYVSVEDFRSFMRRNQNMALRFLSLMGERLRSAEHRLESMVFMDARERIIQFLKSEANKKGKPVGYETLITHSLTQQDIANITGTSRQTVTSVLNDLRKSNLIYFNRRSILIRDLGRLA